MKPMPAMIFNTRGEIAFSRPAPTSTPMPAAITSALAEPANTIHLLTAFGSAAKSIVAS